MHAYSHGGACNGLLWRVFWRVLWRAWEGGYSCGLMLVRRTGIIQVKPDRDGSSPYVDMMAAQKLVEPFKELCFTASHIKLCATVGNTIKTPEKGCNLQCEP